MKEVIITGNDLTLEEVAKVCREDIRVRLSEEAKEKVLVSRKIVEDLIAEGKVVYGVTTGFGKFCDTVISADECKKLQRNLIISHAVGAGAAFPREVARGIMLLRINNLAKGYSGIRLETIHTMIDMLNKGVTPIIPEKGSLGASGDLVPLAHMVLPMIGMGKAEYKGVEYFGAEAMGKAGISVVELSAKEGLALINGTQAMTAVGALTVYDALNIVKTSDIAVSLSFEAHNGIVDALDHRLHDVRPHKGQMDSARIILDLLEGSKNTTKQGEIRVQDAYSLRCTPQVHGASKDAINYVKEKVEIEINSVTDNPIIFPDNNEGISGGNFHGQPMALAFDFLCIALSELGNISERRIERMVNSALSGLSSFLIEKGGVNSGYMIVQYAAASLVSENKILSHPASVDSIPSSANQEDHVSMGTIAARKSKTILEHVRRILAMELMCACQAIDLRGDKGMGKGTKEAYKLVREMVPMLTEDRPLYDDIEKCDAIIKDASIVKRVEDIVGEIKF
ncbi:histidine ammonia-lyase [Clostridium sp. 19966]|uniref:histidine ammonia-lyase n=1 Tax=Clostridium sp. 19966 TaxID=2768166 RepID=UPI0028DE2161|nr:histidine ammonia-lyase [Clostridium sp. 19966]MDT8718839.1 histidine ammonia-lyase [Clostridium sp. 19966]